MTFYVNLDNIKVVDNLSIFVVLKISWFYPIFAGVLYSSEILYNSTVWLLLLATPKWLLLLLYYYPSFSIFCLYTAGV